MTTFSSPDTFLDRIGAFIARRLQQPSKGYDPSMPADFQALRRALQPGDILLVEGDQKVSAAIKYLTQSTWSHAAMYVGPLSLNDEALEAQLRAGNFIQNGPEGAPPDLIEVNLGEGCIAAPLEKYAHYNTRICRPVGLTREDSDIIVKEMISALGKKYDLKNIIDLARYLLPTPPVPVRWRRRMLAFGSGDPTRAICSSQIAQSFQKVRYPILPDVTHAIDGHMRAESRYSKREILHIRHHSLFAPRDFDISPYFDVIKPTIAFGFDYKQLEWGDKPVKMGP